MAITNTAGAGSGDELSPGDRVGGARYLLKRLLGRGTTAEVWLAQDVPASRLVALKFFPRAFLVDANLVERLKHMAQKHQLLQHPHSATTYELICDPAKLALAVEYVDGWSLATMKVDKLHGCYRVEEIEDWIGQLCATLEFAHGELGIIHSDLKPANLLINAQEELKVTDFEMAAIVRKESARRGLSKGAYGGLGFLSPQQVMGEEPSKLDDVYSLGATIFDLLTGTPPFYKGEIFAQICSLKPPGMTERIKELEIEDEPISPVWEDTVARCLAKNPADRPQSMLEVSGLLKRESVAKPAGPAVIVTTPPAPVAMALEIKKTETEKPTETVAPEKLGVVAATSPEPPTTPTVPPAVISPSHSQWPLILGGFAVLTAVICVAGVIAYTSLKHDVAAAKGEAPGITNSIVTMTSDTPGLVDTHFNTGDGASGEVRALMVQPDGKIVVGGRFATFNGVAHKNIVRLNPDGRVDESFRHQGNGTIDAISLESDGEILVAGDAVIRGRPRDHLLRLEADGGVDKSFSASQKLNLEIRALAVQPDGRVIAGGSFTTLNGKAQEHIMRFEANGTPDADFDANVSTAATVWTLVVQADGKILAGGGFSRFNDVAAGHIVRLNENGTLDTHFNTGLGADGTIMAMAVQSDGAILIAGLFNNVNGRAYPHVARLNPDGTVDTTFVIGPGADKNVQGLALQPDGKIIVVGEFTTFENVPCHHLVRLNTDGSVDKSFNPGSGPVNSINCATVQPDGKLLLGGAFTGFNGRSCGGLVRLNNSPARP